MDYRIIWATNAGGPSHWAAGPDRRAIESLLEQAGPDVSWAEVFDDRCSAVAHKAPGRRGLAGFPGVRVVAYATRGKDV